MQFSIGKETFFCIHRKLFFFRILGRGLYFQIDRRKSFSERYGYRKHLRIGRLFIEILKKNKGVNES